MSGVPFINTTTGFSLTFCKKFNQHLSQERRSCAHVLTWLICFLDSSDNHLRCARLVEARWT